MLKADSKNHYQTKHSKAFSLVEISVVIVIIGILISGIAKGVDLYDDFRVMNARKLTHNSVVSRINNLVLWLETTSNKNFLKDTMRDNDPISEWHDINPVNTQKMVFITTNPSQNPRFKKNGIGSLPSVHFDGLDDAMYHYIYNSPIKGDYTFFIVYNSYATGATQDIICFMNVDSGAGSIILEISTAPTMRAFHRDNTNGAMDNLYSPVNMVKFNRDYILKYVRNNSVTQNASLWLNQDLIINSSAYTFGIKSNITINIGSLYNSGARHFGGLISEIILYDKALNPQEYQAVESYLKTKYQFRY